MRKCYGPKTNVSIGDGLVVLNNPNRSNLVLADILGQEVNDKGEPHVLYLNKMVHGPGIEFNSWEASGAISTILTRI